MGPVRLTCQARGLRVDLLRVGRFSAGFAPAGLCDAKSFVVPYKAVRGMLREGAILHLSLDPHAAAPYNRFALTRFGHDPLSVLLRAFRLRTALGAFGWFVPLPLAALAMWLLPAGQGLGVAAVGAMVALVSWRLLGAITAWLTGGGAPSARLCDRFERAVSARLGLTLADEPGSLRPMALRDGAADAPTPAAALSVSFRPKLFAAAAALALGMSLTAVHLVQRFGVQASIPWPVDTALRGVAGPARARADAAHAAGMPDHPSCSCQRVASPLWQDGLPQLSIMIMPVDGEMDEVWLSLGESYTPTLRNERKPRIAFDLAVVNNSTEVFDTVDLVVTFARRDAQGKRRALLERGLHWPAKLRPGEAVKWRVKASGRTELKVDSRHDRRLDSPGVETAPADAFAELDEARLPVVRLHGAMMLSYLRDPRAEPHARALSDLTPAMEVARSRILETQVPLGVCDVRPTPDGRTEMCVFNDTDQLHRGVVISEVGVAKPERHTVRDLFLPGRGLRVSIDGSDGRKQPTYRVEPDVLTAEQ